MNFSEFLKSHPFHAATEKFPVMFVGHGSPMNAIENNRFSETWGAIGRELPKPRAILCVSAHWETPRLTLVTAMKNPKTIYDFYGFPEELYQVSYPAPGNGELARSISTLSKTDPIGLDQEWGLDHGTWSVLSRMYPDADIPVLQLSLNESKSPKDHFAFAKQLRVLRERGVLFIGSGNLVHNLAALRFDESKYDWAIEFDERIAEFLRNRNDQAVVDFLKLGSVAQLAHPTIEHFLPLIYSLALFDQNEQIEFFNEGIELGSLSMRSFISR